MKQLHQLSPDKPAGWLKSLIRKNVRKARWMRVRFINYGKEVGLGENAYLGAHAEVYIPQYLRLGNNVSIGSYLISQVNLCLGDNSLVSSRVAFIGNDHELRDSRTTAYFSGRLPPSTVVLEGDNFVGFGATLLGNIVIGKGAVIAAHSFVNRDVPAGTIVGGVPAKVIGKRFEVDVKSTVD